MINLLPPKEKNVLLQEEKWKLILILEILIFIFFILLSLALFSVKFYVSGKLLSQKILAENEGKKLSNLKTQEFQTKIAGASQSLPQLDSFYSQQIKLTGILEKLSEILPSGVYLNNFSYQKSNSQISISGFSPTREMLLEFKKNLEQQEGFKEVYFPPSSWVKPSEIEFYTTFKIK